MSLWLMAVILFFVLHVEHYQLITLSLVLKYERNLLSTASFGLCLRLFWRVLHFCVIVASFVCFVSHCVICFLALVAKLHS